jgi:hypothetical protein
MFAADETEKTICAPVEPGFDIDLSAAVSALVVPARAVRHRLSWMFKFKPGGVCSIAPAVRLC